MTAKRKRRIRGPWRKLYAAAFNDLKVNLLAKKLGLSHLHAFGCATALWGVAPPGGHIGADKIDGLERQMRWEGAEGALLRALLDVELLEYRGENEGYALHNNEEHGGSFAEAQRQANKRAREAAAEDAQQITTKRAPRTNAERSKAKRLRREGWSEEQIWRLLRPHEFAGEVGDTRHGDTSDTTLVRDDTRVTDRVTSCHGRVVSSEPPQIGDSVQNTEEVTRRHVTVPTPLRVEESRDLVSVCDRARAALTFSQLEGEMMNTMGLPGIPPRFSPALSKLADEGRLTRETVEYVWRDTAAAKAAEGARPNAGFFCSKLIAEAARPPVDVPSTAGPPRAPMRVNRGGDVVELSPPMRAAERGAQLLMRQLREKEGAP